MDINKHIEFFNPALVKNKEIHIIGVGAVGSFIALFLAKLGISSIHIWDFDTVEEHNITNQLYNFKDLNKLKTEALKEHLLNNNPDLLVYCHGKYTNQILRGIIFSSVDSAELRYNIASLNQFNTEIKLLIDTRIGLESGQLYTIDWTNYEKIENYLKAINFKDNEVTTPVSACGSTLSVSPSVVITSCYAVAQLINFVNKQPITPIIVFDAFQFKTRTIK